jgi:hypothetical protein
MSKENENYSSKTSDLERRIQDLERQIQTLEQKIQPLEALERKIQALEAKASEKVSDRIISERIANKDLVGLINISDEAGVKLSDIFDKLNKPEHMDLFVSFATEKLGQAAWRENSARNLYSPIRNLKPEDKCSYIYEQIGNSLKGNPDKDKLMLQVFSGRARDAVWWLKNADEGKNKTYLEDHLPYITAISKEEPTFRKLQCIEELIKNDNKDGFKIGLAADVIEKAPPNQKFTFLVTFAKAACESNSTKAFEKLNEILGNDRNFNAEVILNATAGKKLTPEQEKHFDKLYDEKVRVLKQDNKAAPDLGLNDFNKIMNEMSPRDFGRLLFQEGRIKNAPDHPELGKDHLHAFRESAKTLRNNIDSKGQNILKTEELDAAAESLKTTLTRKQMAFVVESVKQFEDFDKKNFFSKLLTRFVDAIYRTKVKDENIAAGIKELVTKGANIKLEKPTKAVLPATKEKGSGPTL